jgi:hypothetical protein
MQTYADGMHSMQITAPNMLQPTTVNMALPRQKEMLA